MNQIKKGKLYKTTLFVFKNNEWVETNIVEEQQIGYNVGEMLNMAKNEDGIYYYKDDELVTVSRENNRFKVEVEECGRWKIYEEPYLKFFKRYYIYVSIGRMEYVSRFKGNVNSEFPNVLGI